MKYEKSCGCVVFNDGKVLLVRQRDGHFGFPKGHVESEETEYETATREVFEETNVHVEIIPGYRYQMNYIPKNNPSVSKDVVYFLAKPLNTDITPQEGEIAEVCWLDINEVTNKLTYDDAKKLFNDVLSYVEENNIVL